MPTLQSASDPGRDASLDADARWRWGPILLVVGALVTLVWFGRDMTFYHDEWAFILQRDLSVDGLLKPHNEHLSATLVLLYGVLRGTVGRGSSGPYRGVTSAPHGAAAPIVYFVVRGEAG